MEKIVSPSIVDILKPLVTDLIITSDQENITSSTPKVVTGMFKKKNLFMNFVETKLGSVNILVFNLSFSFTLKNKTPKEKVFEIINSFNKEKPGIKATFVEQKKNTYVISFRSDGLYMSDENESIAMSSFIKAAIPIMTLSPTLFSQLLKLKNIEHKEITAHEIE